MIMRSPYIALGLAVALGGLGACRTTAESEWLGNPTLKPFRQATQTCEDQVDNIRVGSERDRFYLECMAAFGWQPRPGEEPNLPTG